MEAVETRADAQPEGPSGLQGSSRNSDLVLKSAIDASRISPVSTTPESCARVSLNGKDDIGGSDLAGGVASGTQVPAEATGDKISFNLGPNEGGLEDSEMNGLSSQLKMQESKNLLGMDTVLDVLEENEKTEFDSSNGISLVADASGDVDFSNAEEKGDYEKSFRDKQSDGNEGRSDVREMEDQNSGDEEHEFSVGDFVWGKIRSHPWWPGRIYDPIDASDYAKKLKQGDKILVAYFGDSTFAWCDPSQLKPLEYNFVEMSHQSCYKNFVNSVENAMDEIGRLVDLKMTCSCVPKDNLIGFGRTLVVNAGIKEGLLIPEGGIDKFSSGLFEPAELLTQLKDAAQEATATSMLEVTVLKSWLLAFYRAKGGHHLPSYYDPKPIPGLEDKYTDCTYDIGDYNGMEGIIQGPEEGDWVSLPGNCKYGQTNQNPLHECQGVALAGHYQRRKQKSLAEIFEGKTDVQAVENTTQLSGGEKRSSQSTSSTKRKRKSIGEGAADERKFEGNDGTQEEELHKPKSTSGEKKGRSVKSDEGKDKMEDAAKAIADLGQPRRSGRKKSKGYEEADVVNKGTSDMLSKSDGGELKNNSACSPSLRNGKKRNFNLKYDNGGKENEVMKKSNSAEKVEGSNPSARGRKKRNSNLKDDNSGEKNEEMTENLNSAEKVDGCNPSSRSRKKRNSNLKNDNGGGKNEGLKENPETAEKLDGSNLSSRSRKKRNSNAKVDNVGGKNKELKERTEAAETMDESDSSSRGRKKGMGKNEDKNSNSAEKVDGTASSKGKTRELQREESFSRERKKSRYLSPPYTNIDKGHSKKEMEVKSLKVSGEAQLGEKAAKAANQFSGDRPQNQLSKETGAAHLSDSLGHRTPNQDRAIDPSLVKAPANEILSKIRSAALDPLYLKDSNSVDMVGQFFSVFRSSSYCSEYNGENSESHRGKKKLFQKSELESAVNQTSNSTPEYKSQRKKIRKREAKSIEPKQKTNSTVGNTKDREKTDKDKESNGVSPGASLFVTFGPGSCLPSKNDLIKIYGKFGAIDEQETEMSYSSNCGRVVFLRSSEAEEAFNVSQLSSPFGTANVTFRLYYLSAETKTRELKDISRKKPSSSTKKGGKTPELQSASQSPDNNLSELMFMKEKLERITSLIETSDGKISPSVKSTLEGEMKVLLEKVSTMIS